MLGDQVGELVEHVPSLAGKSRAPFGESGFCCGHRGVDVLLTGQRDVIGYERAVFRVVDGEFCGVLGVDVFIVDDELFGKTGLAEGEGRHFERL